MGCDHFLGSGKLKDRCGVCDGNGDSCAFVKSSYTKNYKKYSKTDSPMEVESIRSDEKKYFRQDERLFVCRTMESL